jgi:hypothetical protein
LKPNTLTVKEDIVDFWLPFALPWFLVLLFVPLQTNILVAKTGNTDDKEDLKAFFSLFIPRKLFFITPLILDANILVYPLMAGSRLGILSFKAVDLLHWGR